MSDRYDASSFPHLRPVVLMALAWRVASELMRRHQAALDLRVHQYYPGMSPLGIMRLYPGRVIGNSAKETTFVEVRLGGGENGLCSVRSSDGVQTWVPPITELLVGKPTDEIVNAIEAVAHWPHRKKQSTTPPVLIARLLARFLERYMLAPTPYRASSGWLDNNGPGPDPVSWLQDLPEGAKAMQMPETERINYALRFWLVHPCVDHATPATSWSASDGPALVFDIATAECIPLHGPARVNLMKYYWAHGHSLHAVIAEVERLIQAP